jgi:ketosteroid isomerase-like protein
MDTATREAQHQRVALAYLQAIADGADPAAIGPWLHEDIVFEAFPNRIRPHGGRVDRAGMLAAARRGRQTVHSQRYDVRKLVAQGDLVALEVDWSATLAVPFGELPVGSVMRAHLGIFLEFRDGRIVAQRQYDCYQPW